MKNIFEGGLVLLILLFTLMLGLILGDGNGYDRGFAEGVAVEHGGKWNCAYSKSTGFIICDKE